MAWHFLPLDYENSLTLLDTLQSLYEIPHPELIQLIQLAVNYLRKPGAEPSMFTEALSEVQLPPKARETAATAILLYFQLASKRLLTRDKIQEDLHKLDFPEEAVQFAGEIWENQKDAVTLRALSQMASCDDLLDMEWKFGVTTSDSIVENKGECFIQLKLIFGQDKGTREVNFEMSPKEFYEFYGELEKIKTVMEITS